MGFDLLKAGGSSSVIEEFDAEFEKFQRFASEEANVLDDVLKGLKEGVTVRRKIKIAEIREMRIRRRANKADRHFKDLIDDIKAAIEQANKMLLRTMVEKDLPVGQLDKGQQAVVSMEFKKQMEEFDIDMEELRSKTAEALEDVKTLRRANELEIAHNATLEDPEEEELQKLETLWRQLEIAEVKLKNFFKKGSA